MSTQLRCGHLSEASQAERAKGLRFTGKLTMINYFSGTFILRDHPRADPANAKAPAFEAFLISNGTPFPCGSAWLMNSANGDFLSITLDNPAWSTPLNLSAFPGDGRDEDWRIIWSRPRGAAKASSEEGIAA